jgi:hypothetical protein
MNTSVGTKARKKQPASSTRPTVSDSDRGFETSLLALESACFRILENRFVEEKQDLDLLYWQQRLKNITTPISLALAEYRGPRRFHYHYRHRKDDESILHPVMEPSPVEMLAQVCQDALRSCRSDLVGIMDPKLVRSKRILESALQTFLVRYRAYKASLD